MCVLAVSAAVVEREPSPNAHGRGGGDSVPEPIGKDQ